MRPIETHASERSTKINFKFLKIKSNCLTLTSVSKENIYNVILSKLNFGCASHKYKVIISKIQIQCFKKIHMNQSTQVETQSIIFCNSR